MQFAQESSSAHVSEEVQARYHAWKLSNEAYFATIMNFSAQESASDYARQLRMATEERDRNLESLMECYETEFDDYMLVPPMTAH